MRFSLVIVAVAVCSVSAEAAPMKIKPKSKTKSTMMFPKPTGKETVSFKKDIAPFMVNLCSNCHNGRRKRGGLSLMTFRDLMRGGESGAVVVPGNLNGSRLWDLVGKQNPIKMPQGNARITRANWNDLRTWIQEGAKFDGGDAGKTLRSLVPTEKELELAKFAKFSDAEFFAYRKKRTADIWERVLPKEILTTVERQEFFIVGNVSKKRLEEVGDWSAALMVSLRKQFSKYSRLRFKGKLVIFVMKDRFSFQEFHVMLNRQKMPRGAFGQFVVDSNDVEAYVVLQDVIGLSTAQQPSLKVNLTEQLTAAFLKRTGKTLPDWLLHGTGLRIARSADRKDAYLLRLYSKVPGAVKYLARSDDLFADGTFSPADVGAVGQSLISFLVKKHGAKKWGQFIRCLQSGKKVPEAIKVAYRSSCQTLAKSYLSALRKKHSR